MSTEMPSATLKRYRWKYNQNSGLFKKINAIGWTIDEYGCCQISINITDHYVSPIHEVYDAIRKLALEEGVVVTGSELVGLIPEEACIMQGLLPAKSRRKPWAHTR